MLRLFCVFGFVLCASVCIAQSAPPESGAPPVGKSKVTVKKTYANLLEILEELPRKPKPGDNVLAATSDNEWLTTNVRGCGFQISGKVDSSYFESTERSHMLQISLAQEETWQQYKFDISISAMCDVTAKDVSTLRLGDSVTLKGVVGSMQIGWGHEHYGPKPLCTGYITLQLTDCKLVAHSKGSVAETKPVPKAEAPNVKAVPTAPEQHKEILEFVPTSVNGIDIWRLKVPGGWLVFAKWHMPASSGDATGFFYPDPRHLWDIRSSTLKGTPTKSDEQLGKQSALTPSFRPLGTNLVVDKNGIIWWKPRYPEVPVWFPNPLLDVNISGGLPVGIWGVDGVPQHQ